MDVLVIGGGAIGISAAYFLLKEGLSVTILDQNGIGSGCSYGNAGLIVPSHAAPLARPGVISRGLRWMLDSQSPFFIKLRPDLALYSWLLQFREASQGPGVIQRAAILRRLGFASREILTALIAEEGLECDYRETGVLQLFLTERGFRDELQEIEQYGGTALEPDAIRGASLRSLEPSVAPEVVGGLYHRHDAHLNPAVFVRELSERVRSQGGTIFPRTKVVDFVASGERVERVRTTQGEFAPGLVLLAAGAWTPGIGHKLGLDIPIQAGKGYSLTYQMPPDGPSIPLLLGESWVAVTPMGSRLRFAGTLEFGGMGLSIDRRRLAAVAGAPSRYLTLTADLRLVETWSGLRPVTPDGLPIIGRPQAWSNLILAAGHAMLGISLAAVTGKVVADLACERPCEFDLDLLKLERF